MNSTLEIYNVLVAEWNNKPANLPRCEELLDRLKVALTTLEFLPTNGTVANSQELLIVRNILEIGAQWSVAAKNIPAFERYVAQLKSYYLDYDKEMMESTFKYQILGLNLLFLLSQYRVAEFHTELELLPAKEIQNNIYIRHPVSMEQYLMEGSYNKVFLSKGNVPAESYNFFIDILLDTVREEIGTCIEKAYTQIAISEAGRMLFLENHQQLHEYSSKRGWKTKSDMFVFTHESKNKDEGIPAFELALQTIGYAKELEMII